jgi:hypothetical protein
MGFVVEKVAPSWTWLPSCWHSYSSFFSFTLHDVRPVNPHNVTTCTRIMPLEQCRMMEGHQYFEGTHCVHLFFQTLLHSETLISFNTLCYVFISNPFQNTELVLQVVLNRLGSVFLKILCGVLLFILVCIDLRGQSIKGVPAL